MSRIQLNLRMDDDPELMAAIKTRAKEERITVKELVLDAIKKRLQQPLPTPNPPSKNELHELKERINGVSIGIMGEMRKRDEQLAKHEESIYELASAIARLEQIIDEMIPVRAPRIPIIDLTDDQVDKLPPWKQWEAECTDLVYGLSWGEHGRNK